ncbi:60S ribosomal protein L29 [Sciurus carolinensis]|uniref:60S ribosomal protein L29 n=1 Tax=Sciurus carolinensis TaxID=30640 RepID=A0AA41MDR2_SCICA|nr:60S ribosomal protein L29 [Sciurus carolinensis]
MSKSKNHIAQNQSPKWHRNGIKKLPPQRYGPLKGADPKFLRNMCFAEKHKKGLKEMQANNTNVMKAHAKATKALVKPKEVKPKDQRVPAASLTTLPCLPTPSSRVCSCLHSQGL